MSAEFRNLAARRYTNYGCGDLQEDCGTIYYIITGDCGGTPTHHSNSLSILPPSSIAFTL